MLQSATVRESCSMKLKIQTLVCCLVAANFALGQDTRGTILGRVTDSTGANVANAEVTATNIATGVAVSAKTNESGNYSLPFLMPGVYTVTTQLQGFKKFVRDNVQVRVNDSVELNIPLTVGDVAESINVTVDTPL